MEIMFYGFAAMSVVMSFLLFLQHKESKKDKEEILRLNKKFELCKQELDWWKRQGSDFNARVMEIKEIRKELFK